jgi:hypothetical protein
MPRVSSMCATVQAARTPNTSQSERWIGISIVLPTVVSRTNSSTART